MTISKLRHHHHGTATFWDWSENPNDGISVLGDDSTPQVSVLGPDIGDEVLSVPDIAHPAKSPTALPAPIPGHTGQSGGFTIIPTYDTSITSLQTSDPTLYNEITGAIGTAIQFYENTITNNVTITLDFGYGNVDGYTIPPNGAVAESVAYYNFYSWSQIYNAAEATLDGPGSSGVQQAAFATLPSTDPNGGSATYALSLADAAALGLGSGSPGLAGYVGLSNSYEFGWTQPNSDPSGFDAVGAIEHEISEDMGRVDLNGNDSFDTGPAYTLMDFFHYSAQGGNANAAYGSPVGQLEQPFVSGYNANTQTYFSYDGQTVTLAYDQPQFVAEGNDVADWASTVPDDSYGYASYGATELVSTTDLEEMNVLGWDIACFLPGTQIATPAGEVAVERLAVGDMVVTCRHEIKPITWIGRGKGVAISGRRTAMTPIIVKKGALADNVPNRDLRITKGHCLYIDSVLVPAEYLVNHRSILWDDTTREVKVYHIELDSHDLLLANGAAVESYRDDGNRWMFLNHNGNWDQPEKPSCAPVLTGGPIVDAIWRRLLDRSGPRPGLPLTEDPDLHLIVDGKRLEPALCSGTSRIFRLAEKPAEVRIASRAASPQELGLTRDSRCLGVAVRQIMVAQAARLRATEAADDRLVDGFHEFEEVDGIRWTDGDALIPVDLFDGFTGPLELTLRLGGSNIYIDDSRKRQAA